MSNKYYVLLPKIVAQGCNAVVGQIALASSPVMAVTLFGHNLGRSIGMQPTGVGVIHHSSQTLTETASYGMAVAQQRRGAVFIDKTDYATNSNLLSLQPTAQFHWNVSILLVFDAEPDLIKIRTFLDRGARIAGGSIIDYDQLILCTNKGDLKSKIRGFWIVNRADLFDFPNSGGGTNDPLTTLISALGGRRTYVDSDFSQDKKWIADFGMTWLQPAVLGYALITEFIDKRGSRGGVESPHAYAEDVYGIVQFVSTRKVDQLPLWTVSWEKDEIFLLNQYWV